MSAYISCTQKIGQRLSKSQKNFMARNQAAFWLSGYNFNNASTFCSLSPPQSTLNTSLLVVTRLVNFIFNTKQNSNSPPDKMRHLNVNNLINSSTEKNFHEH